MEGMNMMNTEKAKRIIQAINETERQLERATKKYNYSIACLKMDIAENAELGNPKSANRAWVDYCNEDKAEMNRYKAHIDRLAKMLHECVEGA